MKILDPNTPQHHECGCLIAFVLTMLAAGFAVVLAIVNLLWWLGIHA